MARIDMEAALDARLGGLLALVWATGDDATDRPLTPSAQGTAIYSDPIAFGLSLAGVAVSSPFSPTDADVAAVPAGRAGMALDLAEYRLILNAMGSFTDVNESAQDRSQSWSGLRDAWMKRAADLERRYAAILNPTRRGGMSSGTIRDVPPTACPPRWGPGYGRCGPGYGPYPWGYRR